MNYCLRTQRERHSDDAKPDAHPIGVSREIEVETPAITSELFDTSDDFDTHKEVKILQEQVSVLNEELAAARNDTSPSEAEIRRIIRDKVDDT